MVAQAMMHANTEEAIKAFGAALHSGLPKPTKHWLPPRGNRECRTMQPLASAGPARASEQVKSPPAQSSRKLGSVVLLECT